MEIDKIIFERRSIRSYTEKEILDKDLNDIITAGLWAPSGLNLQPWHFVVIKNEENLQKLKKITGLSYDVFKGELEKRFPKNREVIDETGRFLNTLGGSKCAVLVFFNEKYDDEFSVLQGVGAAIQNMCLTAWSRGIGSCWITAVLKVKEHIENEFGNGLGSFAALLTLGYPLNIPKAPVRKENRIDIL